MAREPQEILAEAEEHARQARQLLEHPAMARAYQVLTARCIERWRHSEAGPAGAEERDAAFGMMKALDALLDELQAAVTGAAVARRNHGAQRPQGRI